MSAEKIKVERLENGRVSVRKGTWSDVFPEDRREQWAAWYERMHVEYSYLGYLDMAKALRDLPE
ncbi:hypothetical protein MHM88_12350 [Epibacterium sp. MM17-32]|uniref:hypothetical protein n=1 Tax=Epibacterium sp. MM17-32 TaxID=2917734 RepID=UPI001EF49BCA|nr:hypothetical protein [Epibacterium sp. MM17-32]MCG7628599.1 hypothetical protein [Epibacterium sp. MM17-32]